MYLETERLFVGDLKIEDAGFIFDLMNAPEWISFIGDKGINSIEKAGKHINESLLKGYTESGLGMRKVCLKTNNQPIGICGFLQRDYLEHPDIGFAFLPKFARQGYAYETTKSIMEYGRDQLKFKKIFAICLETNTR
ncbi:GNAT family N-acetyltransferase [Maribacter chungangensis]|uniref:GNAT family N-acetyltransferase n=1 Tax=Maribacter chungangensis TaxID=1069117 RepID=A0ABW3B6P0_9FLAO